jgi:hypothetical protein
LPKRPKLGRCGCRPAAFELAAPCGHFGRRGLRRWCLAGGRLCSGRSALELIEDSALSPVEPGVAGVSQRLFHAVAALVVVAYSL